MYESPQIIRVIGELLRQELPSGKALTTYLKALENYRYDLAEARVDWLKLLHEKEAQMLHPKDKDFTELDRRTMLHASVAVIRRDYEFLVAIETIVDQRLAFGRELISYL